MTRSRTEAGAWRYALVWLKDSIPQRCVDTESIVVLRISLFVGELRTVRTIVWDRSVTLPELPELVLIVTYVEFPCTLLIS